MTRMTRTIASMQRVEHSRDRLAHGRRGVEGDLVLHAGRETLGQPVQLGLEPGGPRPARWRSGAAVMPRPTASRAVEQQVRAVVLGAQLGAADVLQAHQRAVGARLQDDVSNCDGFGEPADGAHADLEGLSGWIGGWPTCPAATCDVLLAQRADHVGRGQSARLARRTGSSHRRMEYLRSPKMMHVGDPGDALERVPHVDVDVVADEERRRSAPPARRRRRPARIAARLLVMVTPVVFTSLGRRPERRVDAVLHVDRGQIDVAVEVEGRGDRARRRCCCWSR